MNLNFGEDSNIVKENQMRCEEEWNPRRRKSFPLDFSFASFREISQGYIQYGGEGKDREDFEHSLKKGWKI